eukprot:2622288-Alexandrium_andersonii.AAC.1
MTLEAELEAVWLADVLGPPTAEGGGIGQGPAPAEGGSVGHDATIDYGRRDSTIGYSPIARNTPSGTSESMGGSEESGGRGTASAEGGGRHSPALPILRRAPQMFDLPTPPVPLPTSAEGGGFAAAGQAVGQG